MNSFSSLVRTGLFCFVAASIPIAAGCGNDVGVSGSTGTGGHATGSGGGCSNGNTGSAVGGSEQTGTGGSAVSTGVGGGPAGTPCGGFSGSQCAEDEFCDYHFNTCGASDEGGSCVKRPMACDAVYEPTCGCGGQIYGNACTANAAGHDVGTSVCPAPAGLFACGEHFCDPKTQYCQLQISDVATEPDTYTCMALPAGCGASPSCPCLVNEPCSNACTMQNGGGLKLSCPGG